MDAGKSIDALALSRALVPIGAGVLRLVRLPALLFPVGLPSRFLRFRLNLEILPILQEALDLFISIANAAELFGKMFGLIDANQPGIRPAQAPAIDAFGDAQKRIEVFRPMGNIVGQMGLAHEIGLP